MLPPEPIRPTMNLRPGKLGSCRGEAASRQRRPDPGPGLHTRLQLLSTPPPPPCSSFFPAQLFGEVRPGDPHDLIVNSKVPTRPAVNPHWTTSFSKATARVNFCSLKIDPILRNTQRKASGSHTWQVNVAMLSVTCCCVKNRPETEWLKTTVSIPYPTVSAGHLGLAGLGGSGSGSFRRLQSRCWPGLRHLKAVLGPEGPHTADS